MDDETVEMVDCPRCGGTGWDPDMALEECDECEGTGLVAPKVARGSDYEPGLDEEG